MSAPVELCRQLLKIRPKCPSDLVNKGFKLKRLGSGAFRETYEIRGWDTVIKFPIPPKNPTESNLHHAQTEIKTLRKIHSQKKFKALREVVPEIYYSNLKDGVLATKKYYKISRSVARGAAKAMAPIFNSMFDKCNEEWNEEWDNDSDIEAYNIMGEYKSVTGWNGRKVKFLSKVILIDLGLV